MCTDYYFKEWNKILVELNNIAEADLSYQLNLNEKKRCVLAQRLVGVLGEYCSVYESVVECLQQTLQVQKTKYILDVVHALVDRILELQKQLSKLEATSFQFMGYGLIAQLLTTYDVELKELPCKENRYDAVNEEIKSLFDRVRIKKEEIAAAASRPPDEDTNNDAWWENGDEEQESVDQELKVVESEETIQRRTEAILIQAHERNRKIILENNLRRLKKEKWTKELQGTLKAPASAKMRQKAAALIQQFIRTYFELKRKKLVDARKDEILCIRAPATFDNIIKVNPFERQKEVRLLKGKKIHTEWRKLYDETKEHYMKYKKEDSVDDFKDKLRYWFRQWYDQIRLFPESIPPEHAGGSRFVFTEEAPTPSEYLQINNALLLAKNQDKATQRFEKAEKKRQKELLQKEERLKKKLEQQLLEKLMKNPATHPGYTYPKSEKTENLLQTIKNYETKWSALDLEEGDDIKVGFIKELDLEDIWTEIRDEARKSADEAMREELKQLKEALKIDYENNNEKMPEQVKKKYKKKKAKTNQPQILKLKEKVIETMEDLAMRNILQEYPQTKLDNFRGEYNYIGDDLRCMLMPSQPQAGEFKHLWWEKCLSVKNGFQKFLLVGPDKNGKTVLVHALATLNDAILFELDPVKIAAEGPSSSDLEEIVTAVAMCATAVQPSVIYIKHLQKIFYKKAPPGEAYMNRTLFEQIMVKKLCKKIKSHDRITLIGSCAEPWLTKSQKLLRLFPSVILLPNFYYTDTVKLLKDWMQRNKSVPKDLELQPLAQVLQGYSYGHLQTALDSFLTGDTLAKSPISHLKPPASDHQFTLWEAYQLFVFRVVGATLEILRSNGLLASRDVLATAIFISRIAAFGLNSLEIYDFIKKEQGVAVDYNEYLTWYYDKTTTGINELNNIKKEKDMKAARELYEEKMRKFNEKNKPKIVTI